MMRSRFNHILIPLDFSEKNLAALDVGLELAVTNHSRVTLVHVIETIEHTEPDEDEDFYSQLAARANSELETRAQPFGDAGMDVEIKVIYGKRLPELVDYTASRQIDLVVMSSRKIDREQPAASIGTLSHQVSVLCDCPVLLVK